MKRLKQWVRSWLDWLAVKLGYTLKANQDYLIEECTAWRVKYAEANRRWNIAQDRLNKLMRYKHVQAVAAMIDAGRAKK